jgi:hypothetical protein
MLRQTNRFVAAHQLTSRCLVNKGGYLDDLAQKTRRGQVGRVRAGRIPGGRSYGYDIVAIGEDRGQRTINQAEAEIIRRIFRQYVDGSSALEIVGRLNRERIAGPHGRESNASTINGSRKRLNGIINNRPYIGKIVYNRQRRFLRNNLRTEAR